MKYKNFGFDLDGVLYDWLTALIPFLKIMGYSVDTPQEVYEIVNKNDLFVKNLSYLPMPYTTLQPPKHVVRVVNNLAQQFNIFYITYRPKSSYISTKNWLKFYKFPCYENLIISNDKTVDIRVNKIEYFVEDREWIIEKIKGSTNVIYKRNFYGKDVSGIFAEIKNLKELEEIFDVS